MGPGTDPAKGNGTALSAMNAPLRILKPATAGILPPTFSELADDEFIQNGSARRRPSDKQAGRNPFQLLPHHRFVAPDAPARADIRNTCNIPTFETATSALCNMSTTLTTPSKNISSPSKKVQEEQSGRSTFTEARSFWRILVVVEDELRFEHLRSLCPQSSPGSPGTVHWLAHYETARDAMVREAYDVVILDARHHGLRLLADMARSGSDVPVIVIVDHMSTTGDAAGITCEFLDRAAIDANQLYRSMCNVVSRAASARAASRSQTWWRCGGPTLSGSITTVAASESVGVVEFSSEQLAPSAAPTDLRGDPATGDGLLADMLDHLPLIAAHIDEDGTILDCGGLGLKALGIAPEWLRGKNVFAHPDFPATTIRLAMRGTPVTFVRTWNCAGRPRHFECHFRFDTSRQRGAVGFVHDVTDRIEAERACEGRDQMLAGVLQHLPAIIGRIDTAGTIREVDGAGLADLAPSTLVGTQFIELFPEGRAVLAQAQTGRSGRFEIRRDLDTAQEWHAEFHLSLDRQDEGSVVFFGQDVTRHRRLEHELVDAVDAERRRLGADLHDEVGQLLTGITCLSTALTERLRGSHDLAAEEAATIAEVAREALAQTRALARGLAATRLARHGLSDGLADLQTQVQRLHEVDVRLHLPAGSDTIAHEKAAHLFRIAQEAITNAVRHGQATTIDVMLTTNATPHRLVIADNGRGFDPQSCRESNGSGLGLMEYRAALIGGSLQVSSDATNGTRIEVSFTSTKPYPHENAC